MLSKDELISEALDAMENSTDFLLVCVKHDNETGKYNLESITSNHWTRLQLLESALEATRTEIKSLWRTEE